MKKFAGFVAAGAGALAMGFAGTASAAPSAHVSGNFQYLDPVYACDAGMPTAIFNYRTLNIKEAQVVFSAPGYAPYTQYNVDPYTGSKGAQTLSTAVGKSLTVTVSGSTSGSKFSMSVSVPKTCEGLPNIDTVGLDWDSIPKVTAQPTPSTTTPAPTTSAPTTSTPAPTTSTPAPSETTPAPTNTTTGPKVDTDYVGSDNNSQAAMVAALGGAALVAGAGSVVVARRRK